ncbi:MAG: HAD family hydrolase [Firmicutes bacterium]|nr:HAD family hydrolase [Bacillota bacterium]
MISAHSRGAVIFDAYGTLIDSSDGSVRATRTKLYIGSTSDHRPLMDDVLRNGIMVDHVFSSESLRAYKPHPAFYHAILKHIGCDPSDTVFVGDSLHDDVCGPSMYCCSSPGSGRV